MEKDVQVSVRVQTGQSAPEGDSQCCAVCAANEPHGISVCLPFSLHKLPVG